MRAVAAFVLVAVAACRLGFDLLPDPSGGITVIAGKLATNVSTSQTITVDGGLPPYGFATTAGSIDQQGRFRAPAYPGQARITVTDAEGASGFVDVEIGGDRLFVVGGQFGGNPQSDVWSGDGRTFTRVGQLPVGLESGALVVFEDRMLYIGGALIGDAAVNTIYESRDGVAWQALPTLPFAVTAAGAAVHRGEIWVTGGYMNVDVATAWHSADAVNWTAAPSLPTARHELDAVSFHDQLYVLGGHSQTIGLLNEVLRFDDTQWALVGNTRTMFDYPSATVFGGQIIRAGGGSNMERSIDAIAWAQCTALPTGLDAPAMAELAGKLFVIGGNQSFETTDCLSWTPHAVAVSTQRTAAVAFTPN